MALANIAAQHLHNLVQALARGDTEIAGEIQQRLVPANLAVTARFGVAGLKAALDLLGGYGGPPRLPLRPLSDEDRKILENILTTAEIL